MGFVGFYVFKLVKLKRNVLGVTTIVPIRKESLLFPPDSELENFYELKTSSTTEDKPNWLPYSATYTFNSDGLNERFDYAVPKAQNTIRIITLGDSFTFGQFVDTKDNWTEVLEDMLNENNICEGKKIEIINLGVYGYDILFASHRFKIRGVKYDPDLVLWLLNDHNFTIMPQLTKERVNQLEKQLTEEDLKNAEKTGNYYLALDIALKEVDKKYSSNTIAEQEYAAFYEFAKYYEGKLVLLSSALTPEHRTLLRMFSDNRNGITITNDKNIKVWEIEGATLEDGHPSKYGHKRMAEDMYQYLRDHAIILCQ